MNILILDSWLREHLQTNASAKKIAECLSLCGPSAEGLKKIDKDWVYDIEITTNRIDTMSVRGIAQEAAAILPRFGIKAKLKPLSLTRITNSQDLNIKITNNPKLCPRILAIKLTDTKLGPSPEFIQKRLKAVDQRPLNNAIDVTNYVMWEIGHPIHVFDLDALGKKIIVREAKKGEKLTTLDDQTHALNGGEVVFDNGQGKIIDLPGIMGTKNTVVNQKTKNLLLWIESVDPIKIRQASMKLNIRSQAAILNEKAVDPELGKTAILRAIELMQQTTQAKIGSRLIDIYPQKPKSKTIKVALEFINQRLGIELGKSEIKNYLQPLGFVCQWQGNALKVKIPSSRSQDMAIPEDVVEEVARIYGYHNLPSQLMTGALPEKLAGSPFAFENKVKQTLKGLGGVEVYTSSLVPQEFTQPGALSLKNPLGEETKYLRTSLKPSLFQAAKENAGEKDPFFLFEMANIYLPQKNDLPQEQLMLAGILIKHDFRTAKGMVESLLEQLNIKAEFIPEERRGFAPAKYLEIVTQKKLLGEMGETEEGKIYFEFQVEKLIKHSQKTPTFQPLPKYPAQIEDLTLILPKKTKVGELMEEIQKNQATSQVELKDIYKDNYTFRIWYQNPKKTLTNEEVERIRKLIIKTLGKKFGATSKD